MATAIKNLTKIGTDVRKIAALLRAKAPEGHMLAYISPEEAQVLKDRGGSGKPHADTGIPSFELDDSFALQGGGDTVTGTTASSDNYGGDTQYSGTTAGPGSADYMNQESATYGAPQFNIPVSQPIPNVQAGAPVETVAPSRGYVPTPTVPVTTPQMSDLQLAELGAAQAPPGERSYTPPAAGQKYQELDTGDKKTGMSDQTLKQLGIAGLGSLLAASQARKAAASGQAGAQQLQQLATPYQQQGQQLQAQAQAGTLTPAGQQSLQALQAQVAQSAQARGGVGVQQGTAAVEALRQQLLAQQYQLGLQVSSVGDKIAQGAIQTGMQADQYVNSLTSSYFTNLARIAGGVPTSVTIPTGGSYG
jgi:hypothetical protein